MRRLVFDDGKSRKFWEGSTDGATFVVRFGKLGTSGQERRKDFASAAAAEKELAARAAEKLGDGYVEDGGAATAPASAPYPFLFYGHAPGDFAEGANAGHFWEIRFVRAGNDEELRAVATAWADALAGSPVATVDWHFAGPWALARCGEDAPSGDDHHRRFFAAVEKAMRAVHAVLPIAEVVFGNGRGAGVGPWDAWSHAEQAWPSPYPEFEDYTRFYGVDHPDYREAFGDASLGTGAKRPAFDEALHAAFARHARAEATAEAAKQKKRKGGLVFAPIDQSEVDRLAALDRDAMAPLNARLEALGASRARPRLLGPSGRVVVWIETGKLQQKLAYADPVDTALRTPELPVVTGWIEAKLSPDGARIAVIQTHNLVVTVSDTDGANELVAFRTAEKRSLKDAAWVSPMRLVVVAQGQLHIVDLSGGAPVVVSSTPAKSPARVYSCRAGTLLVVARYDERSDVWAVRGDELAKLGEAKGEISGAVEDAAAIYVSGAPWRRIDGLPPA